MMSSVLQVFFVLSSAGLLALGIPNGLYNFGSPFYGLIALIPLYLAYTNIKSYREAFFVMAGHAFVVHLASSFWLAFFKDFAAFTLGASALGTAVIAGGVGIFLYLPFARSGTKDELENFSSGAKAFFVTKRILWFCFVYVTYEWCKSIGFLGYPWGTVSSTMFHWRILMQLADITGTYGITFLILLFDGIIAEGYILYRKSPNLQYPQALVSQYVRTAFVAALFFVITFFYGSFRYLQPRKPVKYLNAIFVQQNADPWKEKNDNNTILTSERLTKEKLDEVKAMGKSVDLIVWSEGSLKYRMPAAEYHYKNFPKEEPLIPFIDKCNVPFLMGGSYAPDKSGKKKNHYNGALVFDSDGKLRGAYPKNHLVPFAEVLPFADIPAVANFLKKTIGISAGWTPGDEYVYFDIPCQETDTKKNSAARYISLEKSYSQQQQEENRKPVVRISTPICFDDAFPDVMRPLINYGSELFVNITDDSWSLTKSAEYQHFVIASYRSIETRSTLARSCNSGYSVILDARGKILADLPVFQEAAGFFEIPIFKRTITIYQRLGNWLPILCALSLLAQLVYNYLNRNKNLIIYSERKKFTGKALKKLLKEKKSKKH